MKTPKKTASQPTQAELLRHAYFVYAERECQDGVTSFNAVVNTRRKILEEGELMAELRRYVETMMDEANKGQRGTRPKSSLIVKSLSYLGERPAPQPDETL